MPNGKQIPYATQMDLAEIPNDLPLINKIKDLIYQKGPISLSEYWHLALLDEQHGYYMKNDVISAKGDFITSVEISQMFGEILGIWTINTLQQIGAINLSNTNSDRDKKKFSLVEFGPGRGTLMSDIIRVLYQFNLLNGIEINLIEYSPYMRKLQQEKIINQLQKYGIYMSYDYNEAKKSKVERFVSENKDIIMSIRWFKMYENMLFEDFGDLVMPQLDQKKQKSLKPIIVFAHEFFDALPAHQFVYQKGKGWCEKLVNINYDSMKMKNFDWIHSDGPNENVEKILQPKKTFANEKMKQIIDGDQIEIQAKSPIIINSLSELIQKTNGAILSIDYGENQAFSNSFRGIRKHKFIKNEDILEYPGQIDLSAYVNFAHLAEASQQVKGIKAYDIMTQGLFLESMGLNTRLEMLCKNVNIQKKKALEEEYYRLVSPEEMGGTYKVQYIGLQKNGEVFPFISNNQQIYY
ncbi:hypothetical protein IMG5_173480 [Ichthyophthirius multifiliis]|uniref:Protein arginine methyltransferase NDUFAF7 n=1 Tax=Ichthyophthirius multifiliis TaxID=5932 RepID=G0R1X9_ICHMU|nr:hypothetical protein IMG5_173480 [Ichthyophthirius multifiliis]EGR28531.1 hypothetical protein IMG5_173480 [Ichthyophthirius multifiliis]|eukprot:XP_004029767.1 hypothetical protein IMG5_173480 [Ichthyophthirius multifiliis]